VSDIFERIYQRAFSVAPPPIREKGLYDLYPELADRQPLLRLNSESEESASSLAPFTQNAGSYQNHMWLKKAVDILANNLSPLALRVVTGSGNDQVPVDRHPLRPVLENPNPDMSSADLWRQWVIDQMLGGEEGLEVVGNAAKTKVLEMWPRQPQEFTITAESARYSRIAYYTINDGFGEPYRLTPDAFCHIKFYNPLQRFRGLSPVQAVRLSIIIDQLAQAWTRLFFRNQARPDFAIVAPEGVTKTEKEEMIAELTSRYGSGDGLHQPIVLEQGVTDIKTFSFQPKDTEWMNQREMARDEVAAIVGVPDEMMGYGRDTYENFDTADRVLWTATIVPLIGMRDGALTRFFRRTGRLAENERIATDTSQVPQLQEDRTSKIDQAGKLMEHGYPANTVNDYLKLGLPAIPGGDVGYIPATWIQVGAPRPAPATPATPGTPPAEPAPATPPAEPAPPKAMRRKAIPAYGSPEHESLWKAQQAALDEPVADLQRLAKREFQRQQNEIGRKLRESKAFGRGRFKTDAPPPPVEDLFDLEDEISKWSATFKPKVTAALETIGAQALADLGIEGAFDISRPEVVAAIDGILEAVSRKTNQTTWTDLVQLFKDAEEAGEGIPAIQERLSEYFGDRKSDYQTERIARTTTTSSSNAGTKEAWRQSEVVKSKTWISALIPDRTRDAHAAAHGQTVGLNEYFTVDGEAMDYPGDPNGSVGNVVNCLCGMIAEVEE
jgi:HK97 family phage portal protein